MADITDRIRASLASALPLVSILAVAACSDSSFESTNPGDSTGGFDGSGGAGGSGSGGLGTGGLGAGGSGSGGLGTGGLGAGGSGSGGLGTGGSGSGGLGTGGSGSGGLGTGGLGTGGLGAGGSGSGGLGTGGSGSGGLGSGGLGSGGFASGGIDSGSGGFATGGIDSGTGGVDTGGAGSGSEPVLHIFMLMGQSNMAGVAKFDNGDRNTDDRLQVLGGCNQPAGQWNLANPPLNECPGEKGWNPSDSVGPGMWFAKTLLESLPVGDSIGLVGTAESGESIDTFIAGGSHHQMILNKIAIAKQAPNGRFAGVIFHQGESDSGQSSWPGRVVQLYNEVKSAFGVDYDVPFILGELPVGGCCGGHNTQVHDAAAQLPMGYWVSQDGTNVLDQYHFDHPSVILMGQRYGEEMIGALGW